MSEDEKRTGPLSPPREDARLLDRARQALRAKVREGLEEARRGELIDDEEYFARWKTRLEAAKRSEAKRPT